MATIFCSGLYCMYAIVLSWQADYGMLSIYFYGDAGGGVFSVVVLVWWKLVVMGESWLF